MILPEFPAVAAQYVSIVRLKIPAAASTPAKGLAV